MKEMMNITDHPLDTDRYEKGEDAGAFARKLGLDGLEVLHCRGGNPDFFRPQDLVGVHMQFFNEWVDLWKGDLGALEKEYDSLDQAREVFGDLSRETILQPLREDLERAQRMGASYVVFHVCDVKITELYSYTFSHTDEEVVDLTADLVNDLLDGQSYTFDFLMENLWWPGLTFTRPEMTQRLLDKVHYPHKGFMLDTGHLLHTNLDLATEDQAVDYVLACLEEHRDFLSYIRGIHLNQSLTGAYVRDLLTKQDQMPQTYRQRAWDSHGHVFSIDSHLPWTTPRVREILEAVGPEYLTHELVSNDLQDHETRLRCQKKALEEKSDNPWRNGP